jgi:hypothetical protein
MKTPDIAGSLRDDKRGHDNLPHNICILGEGTKALVQDALALWHAHRDGQVTDLKAEAEALQAALTSQLRDHGLKDPANQRLL